jgi:electron transport complex protein RnfB
MDILKAVLVLGILGIVLGIAIGIFSKLFYVEEDKRIEQILPLLPGANCGGCGFAGCSGMADAIVNKNANPRQCKPIKQEKIDQIKNILDEFSKINAEENK